MLIAKSLSSNQFSVLQSIHVSDGYIRMPVYYSLAITLHYQSSFNPKYNILTNLVEQVNIYRTKIRPSSTSMQHKSCKEFLTAAYKELVLVLHCPIRT